MQTKKIKLRKDASEYIDPKDIPIFDDCVSKEILDKFHTFAREEKIWSYNNRGYPDGNSMTSFASDIINYTKSPTDTVEMWNTPEKICASAGDKFKSLCKTYFFLKPLWEKVVEVSGLGDNIHLMRCWLNGHTFGLGDTAHQDLHQADFNELPGITFLYYMNAGWDPQWGGETFIYKTDGDLLRAVTPKPGRLICFDPRLDHKGTAPARYVNDLRVTCAFHTRVKQENVRWEE